MYYAYDTDNAGRVVTMQEVTEDASTRKDHNGNMRSFTVYTLVGSYSSLEEAYAAVAP